MSATVLTPAVLDDIHRYWFGELTPAQAPTKEKMEAWFRPTPEIDRHIRETYGHLIAEAATQDWDLAALSRRQQVALVVLLDQFPRQSYRDDGRAFAYDAVARRIAKALIEGGIDRFYVAERDFILLPLEHSEDIADQDYGVMLNASEAVAAPAERKEASRTNLDYATKHRDIIRKFGRFPHRNAALGRQSTPEEIEFLKGGRGY